MKDIKTILANAINDALGRKRIPWRNPIRRDSHCGMPLNIVTKGMYRGINPLLLWHAVQTYGFRSRWFGTEHDWKTMESTVKQSARGVLVMNYKSWSGDLVYNLDDVSGCDEYRPSQLDEITHEHADYDYCERLITRLGVDIRVGVGDDNHPFDWNGYVTPNPWISFPHHAAGDYILINRPEGFATMASYYYTLWHELAHWSEVRTKWIGEMDKREMVAEIASAWLAQETDLPTCPCLINHMQYLNEWRAGIAADPNYLFEVATQAWHVVDFVMNHIEDRSTVVCHDPDTVTLPRPFAAAK